MQPPGGHTYRLKTLFRCELLQWLASLCNIVQSEWRKMTWTSVFHGPASDARPRDTNRATRSDSALRAGSSSKAAGLSLTTLGMGQRPVHSRMCSSEQMTWLCGWGSCLSSTGLAWWLAIRPIHVLGDLSFSNLAARTAFSGLNFSKGGYD